MQYLFRSWIESVSVCLTQEHSHSLGNLGTYGRGRGPGGLEAMDGRSGFNQMGSSNGGRGGLTSSGGGGRGRGGGAGSRGGRGYTRGASPALAGAPPEVRAQVHTAVAESGGRLQLVWFDEGVVKVHLLFCSCRLKFLSYCDSKHSDVTAAHAVAASASSASSHCSWYPATSLVALSHKAFQE